VGKGSGYSKGKKYFISLAQNKSLNKVLVGKKLAMKWVLRVDNATVKGTP
jgi:hypothetical protein